MIRSHNPFFCNKFPLEKHPNFRFTEDFDKSLAFDKYSVKAKTLDEFAKECNAGEPKPEEELPPIDMTQEKLNQIHPKPGEEIEIEYETLAEIEYYASADTDIEITEEFESEAMYGIPSAYKSMKMPEPDPNYRRMEEIDDEDEENEFTVEDVVVYAKPQVEAVPIENLHEMSIEFEPAGETETFAKALEENTKREIDTLAEPSANPFAM
jgi:hypothetical protein